MKKFCCFLREHATNVMYFEKKKMQSFSKKELKLYQHAATCCIYRKIVLKKFPKDKKYCKVRQYCHFTGKYRGAAYALCNSRFNVPNEISIVFHKVSNYDYNFIIKELPNESEGLFKCLDENTETYKTFSVRN